MPSNFDSNNSCLNNFTSFLVKFPASNLFHASAILILGANLPIFILALLGAPVMQIQIRQIKYLNNIVEQGHRVLKE